MTSKKKKSRHCRWAWTQDEHSLGWMIVVVVVIDGNEQNDNRKSIKYWCNFFLFFCPFFLCRQTVSFLSPIYIYEQCDDVQENAKKCLISFFHWFELFMIRNHHFLRNYHYYMYSIHDNCEFEVMDLVVRHDQLLLHQHLVMNYLDIVLSKERKTWLKF